VDSTQLTRGMSQWVEKDDIVLARGVSRNVTLFHTHYTEFLPPKWPILYHMYPYS